MKWYLAVILLACVDVCQMEPNQFKEEEQENIENVQSPASLAGVGNNERNKRIINHPAANPYNIHPINQNPHAARMHFKGPDVPLSHNYPADESLANDLELLETNKITYGLKYHYSTAVANEYAADKLANHPELRATIKSIFESNDNSKEQRHHINDNLFDDPSLINDSQLRVIIKDTLRATHNVLELTKEQKNVEHSTDRIDIDNLRLQVTKRKRSINENTAHTSEPPKLNPMILELFGPEVRTPMLDNTDDREIIDGNVGEILPNPEDNKERLYGFLDKDTVQKKYDNFPNKSQRSKEKSLSYLYTTTTRPPKTHPPTTYAATTHPPTSQNDVTSHQSAKGDEDNITSTSPSPDQLQNETDKVEGSPKNGTLANKTSVLVYVVICIMLFNNIWNGR